MRKSRVILIILSVLLVLALILGGVYFLVRNDQETKAAAQAVQAQRTIYEQYQSLVENINQTTLTVTENGKTIGVYDLTRLGLLDKALSDAKQLCGQWDRTDPALFATLSTADQIAWEAQAQRQQMCVTLDTQLLDVSSVLLDLSKEIRVPAKDAGAYFENGAYRIRPEEYGTELQAANVAQALQLAVTGYVVSYAAPGQIQFEVTSCDAYVQPQVTMETGDFDFAAYLQRDAANFTIPVTFMGHSMTLEAAPLLSVDEQGKIVVDQLGLKRVVADWGGKKQANNHSYILDSYVEGPITLDFIRVHYRIDQPALMELLTAQMEMLDATPLEAPRMSIQDDQPFILEKGTYVEVDIKNQKMTYFKDGEVFVHTDVVTGADWGYPTPTGFYAVENKEVKCWLSGPDYNVFVEYWVGYYGGYGIHDAQWRTIFGGQKFLTDGSHGCVNTPFEAMSKIHADIQVGVPVVVHDMRP